MLSGKRSLVVAYLLWFVAGPIGAHRLNLRRYGSALALVVLGDLPRSAIRFGSQMTRGSGWSGTEGSS